MGNFGQNYKPTKSISMPSITQKYDNQQLVSVIVPTYNRADYIHKPLQSVYRQTHRPIELIVVDDGSTDQTKHLIEKWKTETEAEDFIVKYIFQKNQGAPAARNNGLRNSNGRYLQFLDSDDELMPDKLELQLEAMRKEKTPICICDYQHVDENDQLIVELRKDYSINEFIRDFMAVHTGGPLTDKTFFKQNQLLWNEKITKLQDKDYFLKLLMLVHNKSYVNKVLFKWHRHSGEDRISHQVKDTPKTLSDILVSILIFQCKNFWSIPVRRWPAIVVLDLKLLRWVLRIGLIFKKLHLR